MPIQLNISPNTRVDKIWELNITGLSPNEKISITANMQDIFGNTWKSQSTFLANKHGIVNLHQEAPIAGSYSGIDPMGLIWSMKCDYAHGLLARRPDLSPAKINIQIKNNQDNRLAEKTVTRYCIEPDVIITSVRKNNLVGTLFEPSGEKNTKRPAVIVLSGSEGGFRHEQAALLASEGYVAFALAYFINDQSNYNDLPAKFPTEIKNIPLEYFAEAIKFLQMKSNVDSNKIGVIGTSRGGELSLLLASYFPAIKCVVSYVPSNLVQAAFGPSNHQKDEIEPSWNYQGKPIDSAPLKVKKVKWFGNKPVILKNGFLIAASEKDLTVVDVNPSVLIPVEKINGPVLLISAGADEMWPSQTMSEFIMKRLKDKGSKFFAESQHLNYKEAGHLIMTPWWPTTGQHAIHPVDKVDYNFGGSPQADAHAGNASWEAIKIFLSHHLEV